MLSAIALLLALPSVSPAATGEPTISAVLQYGPNLPSENWLPIKFQFDNPTDQPIGGAGVILIKGKSAWVEYRLPVNVAPRSRLITTGYAWFGQIPPSAKNAIHEIGVARWEDDRLREISRCDVLAQPLTDRGIEFPISASGAVMMVAGKLDSRNSSDSSRFRELIAQVSGVPLAQTTVPTENLPREFAAYEPCKYLVWGDVDPNELDPAQRQAILDFLNVGGVLIVASPSPAFDPADSWMGALMPVRIIGHRQGSQIDPTDEQMLLMREPVDMCEAIEQVAGGNVAREDWVVLRDANYVHAAVRPVGLGRVVFTSFPIFGLEMRNEPPTADLWKRLLNPEGFRSGWQGTGFDLKDQALLESMLGQSTIRWSLAAGIATGFVGLILLSQLYFSGFRRPTAFVATIGLSVILTTSLMVGGAMRRQDQQLRGARISLFDASPDGGGIRHEIIAWLGQERENFAIGSTTPQETLRPIVGKTSDPPRVLVRPFAVPDAGVHALKVERVWQADGLVPRALTIAARGKFGPEGLSITIDNSLGSPLREPLLLCNGNSFPLNDAPAGSHALSLGARNPPGIFVNASLSISQAQRFRGNLVAAPERSIEQFLRLTPLISLRCSSSGIATIGFFRLWQRPPTPLCWRCAANHSCEFRSALSHRGSGRRSASTAAS